MKRNRSVIAEEHESRACDGPDERHLLRRFRITYRETYRCIGTTGQEDGGELIKSVEERRRELEEAHFSLVFTFLFLTNKIEKSIK